MSIDELRERADALDALIQRHDYHRTMELPGTKDAHHMAVARKWMQELDNEVRVKEEYAKGRKF